MANPTVVTLSLAAADDDGISASQSISSGASALINGALASGGVATLDTGRRVIITSAGNDSGITFTVVGTNFSGNSQTEVITGANAGIATGVLDFKTVTRVTPSSATAAAIKVGTNGVGACPWISLNDHVSPFETSVGVIVTGTVNYTVQHTYDNDPCGVYVPGSQIPNVFNHPMLTSQTATNDSSYNSPITATRIQINSGTGSVRFIVLQAGIRGN